MSQVVIGDILPRTQIIASGGQTVFSTTWTANYASDVVVYQRPINTDANDLTQQLSYPSQYTVDFIGASQIVQVTLVTPAVNGDVVTIVRNTPANRENLYTNTNFLPSMLNNDFGILTLVDQQSQLVDDLVSPRYNYSAFINPNPNYPTADTILPILGPNQIWVKNDNNSAIVAIDLPTSIGSVSQVDTGLGLTGGPIISSGTVSMDPTLPDIIQLNITKLGTQSQALNMGSHLINNVTDPVNPQDVATKHYVDTTVSGSVSPGTINQIAWYAATGSTVSGLPTANNGVLTTNNVGIPSISNSLPAGLTIPDYLPLAGGTMSGIINMNGNRITNVPAPSSGSDAVNRSYVDAVASGLIVQPSCEAATTANLNATQAGAGVGATLTNAGAMAAFSVDGYNANLNDRILVKNQTASQHNGIYTVTTVGSGAVNWVLTRATDYDQPSEIKAGDLVAINNGTINGGTAWLETLNVVTVDTDPISFSPFSIITAGTGLTKTGNVISLTNPVILNLGGTNADLSTQVSNGGIVWSNATQMQILAGTATANQMLMSGSTATPAWSSATWPASTNINRLLYSSANNAVAELTSVASSVLTTNASGVPGWIAGVTTGDVLTYNGTTWSSSPPADAKIIITDDTTTNANMYPTWVTANAGTLPLKVTSTKFSFNPSTAALTLKGSITGLTGYIDAPSGVKDPNGNIVQTWGYVAGAVNYISYTNRDTGKSPIIGSAGSDSSIGLIISPKNSFVQILDSTSTIGGQLQFRNAANTHFTQIGVAAGQSSSVSFLLPSSDAAGFMLSDGLGNLSLNGTPSDISSSITVNGMSSVSTKVVRSLVIGKMVFISLNISGTSNATTFTITGLPKAGTSTNGQYFPILVTNNGTNAFGLAAIVASSSKITFYNNGGNSMSAWTNSGTKSAYATFWYESN